MQPLNLLVEGNRCIAHCFQSSCSEGRACEERSASRCVSGHPSLQWTYNRSGRAVGWHTNGHSAL